MTGGRQLSYVAGLGVALVIVLLGWFLAIGPQLSAASTARSDATDLQVQNALLLAKLDQLAAVPPGPLRAQLAAAVDGLPSDAALPTFTRQLTRQAQAHHLSVTSLSVGTPAATTGTPAASPGGSGTGTPTTGTLEQIPVSLVTIGLGEDQRAFLRALQVQGPRRALVTATSLAPNGSDDGTVAGRSEMTTTLAIFLAPLDSAGQATLTRLLAGSGSS